MSWHASVITLFPEIFPGPLGQSLAGRALADGVWSLRAHDLREHGLGRHRAVDDTPFGGGAGMVMRPDVVDAAIGHAQGEHAQGRHTQGAHIPAEPALPLVYLTPRGRPLLQADIVRLSSGPGVLLLCGRYEGVDERVLESRQFEQFSVGDVVLSGGETAALVLLDACIRLLPGVMGSEQSSVEESFSDGLLEYPLYTRPAEWQGRSVPPVLLSGHHAQVETWRKHQAEAATRDRRPDLWAAYAGRSHHPNGLPADAGRHN